MSWKHCLHKSRQSSSKMKQFLFLADVLTFSWLHSHLFSLSLSVSFSCKGYSNRGSTNWFFLESATYYLCCEFLPSRVTSLSKQCYLSNDNQMQMNFFFGVNTWKANIIHATFIKLRSAPKSCEYVSCKSSAQIQINMVLCMLLYMLGFVKTIEEKW